MDRTVYVCACVCGREELSVTSDLWVFVPTTYFQSRKPRAAGMFSFFFKY